MITRLYRRLSLALVACLSWCSICFITVPGQAETLSAEASFTPWSGYWWPMRQGKLIFGYNGNPSPLEKYDLLVSGQFPWEATNWEEENHYLPDGEYWYGYCHAWANASVLEDIDFQVSAHQGIYFAVGDKKGLITICHDDDPQVIENCDSDAGAFHRFLLEYIGEQGLPFVADLDNSEQVWSYPVYYYHMETTPGSLTDSAGTFMEYDDVSCYIKYADDFVDPDYQGTRTLSRTYYYRLYKNSEGNYTHGEWTEKSASYHPEWVWMPISQESDNPFINYEIVKEIAQAKDDELEETQTLTPGHHVLTVFPGDEDTFQINMEAPGRMNLSLALDYQNATGNATFYRLSVNNLSLYEGAEISEELSAIVKSNSQPMQYNFMIYPDASNEFPATVHVYLDIVYDENMYFVDIPKSYYATGLAAGYFGNEAANPYYVMVLNGLGLPVGALNSNNSLSNNEKWVEMLDFKQLPYDYLTSYEYSSIRVTSKYPLHILKLTGGEKSLFGFGMTTPRYRKQTGEKVVPILTGSLEAKSANVFLFNTDNASADCRIRYFSEQGDFLSEYEWTMEPNSVEEYSAGRYPGSFNRNGWGIITYNASQIAGQVRVAEGTRISDALPMLNSGYHFYVPYIAYGAPWKTKLILYNITENDTEVLLKRKEGENVFNESISLFPHEKREISVELTYIEFTDEAFSTSWIKLESLFPIAGCLQYEHEDDAIASFPLLDDSSLTKTLNLCHVAANDVWSTGLVLLNPEPQTSEIIIKGVDANGNEFDRYSRIEPESNIVAGIRAYFPDNWESIQTLKIESTNPIGGYAFFGASINDDTVVSGVVIE